MNSIECERVSGTRYNTLDHSEDGKVRKALGEIIRGELAHCPHEEECESGYVRTVGVLPSACKLTEKCKQDTTHVAILVPESLATATSVWLFAERISWPGARISTLLPKLENKACKDLLTVIPIWRYVTLLILYNPVVCLSCTEFDLTPPPNSLTIARFSTLLSPFNT